jgi:response regulator RpfG family c-di-GMP phosphodiesterase
MKDPRIKPAKQWWKRIAELVRVDVYDELSYDRPYRNDWPKEKVLDYIKSESGTHFDPKVVEIFIKLINENRDPSHL